MIIALAVPLFFFLVALELLWARRQGRLVHGYADSLTDLSCGVGSRVVDALVGAGLLGVYELIFRRWSFVDLSEKPVLGWALAFIGVDFFYYWYHRFSHRVNFAWATHVVHHQSEEYNLIVALRQSWFTNLYGFLFYLPLALVGVTTTQFAISMAVSLVYQFWIHTRLIQRMGWLELVLNTPSHHRVHHGRDERYLDCNYAAALIIWDRMFGTFTPEDAEPNYGTVQRFRSYDPLWANIEPFVTLWRRSRAMPSLKDALWLWFAPPEWHPTSEAAPSPGEPPPAFETTQPALRAYALAVFVSAVGLTMWMLVSSATLPTAILMSLAVGSIWSLASVASVLEERPEVWRVEGARLGALSILGLVGLGLGGAWTTLGVVMLAISLPLAPFHLSLRTTAPNRQVAA
ncbi:sterol desaturase family protein [Myxococcota bacterium]|nr:sterol desaturase family protein [Myxococcota bacterium]